MIWPEDAHDEVGAPPLCKHHTEALRRADEHGHVDPDWTERAARDISRACCDDRGRSLR